MGVVARSLPDAALLSRYSAANYTDAFTVDTSRTVSLIVFIRAFYSTLLFRAEGFVMRMAGTGARPVALEALAAGTSDRFAAWTVEDRAPEQMLLCDLGDHTRSCFFAEASGVGTRLWFGSAIIAAPDSHGMLKLPVTMRALVPLHRLYARALLASALCRLRQD